jgi:hypothetical protein
VNAALASTNPEALGRYQAVLTSLNSADSARLVSSVEFNVRKLSQIPSEEEAQAVTDKIVAALKESQEKAKLAEPTGAIAATAAKSSPQIA